MKLLVICFTIVAVSCAEDVSAVGKRTTKRGISEYGGYGYASDYGYGHYGHYSPIISTPVVSKISYGYRPYYGGYYGHGHGLYGYGHGHGLYGYGHGYGLGYGHGYGLGYGYSHYYPWYGYYGLGHGYYGLGHGYYGLGHGYYGLNDWW